MTNTQQFIDYVTVLEQAVAEADEEISQLINRHMLGSDEEIAFHLIQHGIRSITTYYANAYGIHPLPDSYVRYENNHYTSFLWQDSADRPITELKLEKQRALDEIADGR